MGKWYYSQSRLARLGSQPWLKQRAAVLSGCCLYTSHSDWNLACRSSVILYKEGPQYIWGGLSRHYSLFILRVSSHTGCTAVSSEVSIKLFKNRKRMIKKSKKENANFTRFHPLMKCGKTIQIDMSWLCHITSLTYCGLGLQSGDMNMKAVFLDVFEISYSCAQCAMICHPKWWIVFGSRFTRLLDTVSY